MSQYQHIMLAVDFDDNAGLLLGKAVEQARCLKAKLSAVHIDHTAIKPYQAMFDINFDQFGKAPGNTSVKTLKELLAQVEYPVEPHAFVADDFATMITTAIEEYNVDLLVMGHHRYSWLGEVFFSASEPVVRTMPCDILLIGV